MCQFREDGDGFLDRSQGARPVSGLAAPSRQDHQRARQVGSDGRLGLGKPSTQGDDFLHGFQCTRSVSSKGPPVTDARQETRSFGGVFLFVEPS